ncbi:MAG: sigma-70 family RNA polymerase sigma factor [Pseudomonadota bacterium]
MTESSLELLHRLLVVEYESLKTQLARYLGSEDRARDALQDTWLRLQAAKPPGPVKRPYPYLLRIAYNMALKRARGERGSVTLEEARDALNLVDDAPDPERAAEARSEFAALEKAMSELTPRRRDILISSRVEGATLREIATRLNISQRLVEMELKLALMHCGQSLGRKIIQRFGPRPLDGSDQQENDID